MVAIVRLVHEDDNPLTFPGVKWQKWFAWHPVNVKGKKVWMKTVYRCRSRIRIGVDGMSIGWEYGNIFDVLSK